MRNGVVNLFSSHKQKLAMEQRSAFGEEPKHKRGKVDALLALLHTFTAREEKAHRWKVALEARDVETLPDLETLARDGKAWEAFHSNLAQREAVLASKLSEWRERSPPSSASLEVSSLSPFKLNALCAPKDVPAPAVVVGTLDPRFLTEQWLTQRVLEICALFETEDAGDGQYRKPPMALVRCSRGGKTRALKEIAHALHERIPNAAIIRISFNDATDLEEEWEQEDPVGAICRRIAFAAQLEVGKSFEAFRERVSSADILTWLGDAPCVLLVDELNKLASFANKSHPQCRAVAGFLKAVFLKPKNRYFVFSSHTVSINPTLSDYMDSMSGRQIQIRQLPLIPSVPEAAAALNWPDLNPREAMVYGLVPSMIFLGHKGELVSLKRDSAIQKCFDLGLVTRASVERLLKSFFTGEADLVPEPLLELMNTVEGGKVHWIPCHIMEVLSKFASRGSLPNLELVLQEIVSQFHGFSSAKGQSGDAWEHLFVVTLLIRALCRLFDDTILPLSSFDFDGCSVTFNGPFALRGKTFESYCVVDDFVDSIIAPSHFPHISIYFPTHAAFEEVDVIVAAWRDAQTRELYGYQLREGKKLPSKEPHTTFLKSLVIRGVAAQNAVSVRKWQTVSASQIDAFFGESGANWTPRRWAQQSSNK